MPAEPGARPVANAPGALALIWDLVFGVVLMGGAAPAAMIVCGKLEASVPWLNRTVWFEWLAISLIVAIFVGAVWYRGRHRLLHPRWHWVEELLAAMLFVAFMFIFAMLL